jgi:bifunctional non-homologous end joining protein LigD
MPSKSKRAPVPGFIDPQQPLLVDHAPAGAHWLHEIKFDGYRIQVRVDRKRVTVWSRGGLDWTGRFTGIAGAAKGLPDCIIDGEAAILDAAGHADFAQLQRTIPAGHDTGVTLFAFDLLFCEGQDSRERPLRERKESLRAILEGAGERIQFVTHIEGNGPEIEAEGRKLGMEGIVSKRAASRYRPGTRNDDWQKCKFAKSETFTIGGWRETGGYVHAVLAGEWRDGKLHYVGRARTAGDIGDLRDRLRAIEIPKSAFNWSDKPRLEGGEHWTRPELLCEVTYTARTTRQHIRHGMFKGLRDDLARPAKRKRRK